MLTGITLKDYTTFIKERTFDFKATNYKILEDTNVGENRVLKGAMFVGENASGKTQVLNAIAFLLNLLLENSELNFIEQENDDINLNLSLLKLEYYNTKFNNDSILNQWFDFLKNSIYINCLLGFVKSYNPLMTSEQLIEKYAETKDAKKLNKLISNIGYNSEIVFNKKVTNQDNTIMISSEKEMISLKKKGTNIAIPIELESKGNQAFVSLILPFDYATRNDCMIILDEFSSGLHNELEEALIRYFFNNSKNSQLFFTSHSTNLIDTSILRPDQIYSFRFDSKEGTVIKRFSDENPRESQNIEKMYLNGVFDGMPEYNKEFKNK